MKKIILLLLEKLKIAFFCHQYASYFNVATATEDGRRPDTYQKFFPVQLPSITNKTERDLKGL